MLQNTRPHLIQGLILDPPTSPPLQDTILRYDEIYATFRFRPQKQHLRNPGYLRSSSSFGSGPGPGFDFRIPDSSRLSRIRGMLNFAPSLILVAR